MIATAIVGATVIPTAAVGVGAIEETQVERIIDRDQGAGRGIAAIDVVSGIRPRPFTVGVRAIQRGCTEEIVDPDQAA